TYAVKEIHYTLQGEGAHTGRAAVFCRFTGCNLWSGREEDRATAQCRFCDTDFVGTDGAGGGSFKQAEALANRIASYWPNTQSGKRYVVFTGGEPLLQLDAPLIAALHAQDFEIAIETNGTLPAPEGIDWICVSPKGGTKQVQRCGSELKIVHPQAGLDPRDLENQDFQHRFVQPMDGPTYQESLIACIAFCRDNPAWRLSLQTHKVLGIP
ncbi:MAG: 7-carboxy-7-deazaguanine synthase, partial [Rhodospirillaceae bacterium]